MEGGRGYVLRVRSDAPNRCNAEVLPETNAVISSFRVLCTPLPSNMNVRVVATSRTSARVEIEGLPPDEQPWLVFRAESVDHGEKVKIERPLLHPVGPDGRYVYEETGLYAPDSSMEENQWEIRVVHARGIACTEVTLPIE